MRGPGLRNVDLIVSRRFARQGGASLDARVEVFNLFNSPRWDNPSSANRDVTSPRFMQITSSNQAFDRQMRLAVRYAF